MFFEIRCEGASEQVDGEAKYWTIRFAVDAFIKKHNLVDGERVTVGVARDLFEIPRKVGMKPQNEIAFITRSRKIAPIDGKPHVLRYGELVT